MRRPFVTAAAAAMLVAAGLLGSSTPEAPATPWPDPAATTGFRLDARPATERHAFPAALPGVPTEDAGGIQDHPPSAAPAADASLSPTLEGLRIRLPRLGIDLPLGPGDIARDSTSTPEHSAFVFPGSAPLASGGNTYVYAHARVGMFLSLWNVHLDDRIEIYAPGRPDLHLRYTVSRIVPRVDPADTSWLDPAGPERLTLQTSTGPLPSDPRFIVVAVPEQAASRASN